jgi:transcriptional regulator with XRE-family HTH domain
VATRDLSNPHSFGPEEVPWFEALGAAVTALREQRGMAQTELAQRADFTPAWLGRIEAGAVAAPWGDLRRTARALGIGLPDLIREAEAREVPPLTKPTQTEGEHGRP